ncbi:MAG: DUF4389 domain-containing protein [Acidimicrobiia bacterium]|nr:DUF4389 domain-containing protein [Acidimicrobiia bacterium]
MLTQARFVYRYSDQPSRGLAVAGAIFFVKAVLAIPHLIIVGALQYVAGIVAYVGYFIVAFTGSMPEGIRSLSSLSLRWSARAYGWVIGYTDEYPPFETSPEGYPVDAEIPENPDPSRGWATAGIFLLKFLAIVPHAIVAGLLALVAYVAVWIGFVAVAFTGQYPRGVGDFVAGVVQWWLRVGAWLYGLTDEYPPFSLDAEPSA